MQVSFNSSLLYITSIFGTQLDLPVLKALKLFPTTTKKSHIFQGLLQKPNPLGFGFYWVWALLGFLDFLFERAVGKHFG